MNKSRRVEYCLLRYVPNVVNSEFVTIAAIFIEPLDLKNGVCRMSFASDWRAKVQCFDPNAHLQMLEALLTELQRRILSETERSDVIQFMEDCFSNVIQITEWRECAVDPKVEAIETFARTLFAKTPRTSSALSAMPAATCHA